MMRDPFIHSLLEPIDLVELITSDDPLMPSSRGHFKGWHTVHESQSKQSLLMYAEGSPHSGYCFKCGVGGTAIDDIMSQKGVSAAEAIDWLCDK
jgi:DNA primase